MYKNEQKRLVFKKLQKIDFWAVKSYGVNSNLFFYHKASFVMKTYSLKTEMKLKTELPKLFNWCHINIIKSKTGKQPTKLRTSTSQIKENKIFTSINGKYNYNPSNKNIKKNFLPTTKLSFKVATIDQKKNDNEKF